MIQSALHSLEPERRTVLLQLIRYALAGFAITLAVGWQLLGDHRSASCRPDGQLHHRLPGLFRRQLRHPWRIQLQGPWRRDRHHIRMGRFFAINVLGFLLNQAFIWVLVKQMDGPTWWPTIPMIFFTPLITFALHRRYVYS